ncbi:MAG: 16S rRNA (uracil(1498)-N(3))-methyltransferase [Methylococcaceae bacterium]|nr:16S rRNA (uracil(1498)-N(3))-methyltransferase [Methylococcaceae bacterium]MDD1610517.1 16S rRNA (uracil(1498)-N(3))-methyltransferase [Methylococcaceae bacterium]MDD1615263.1 16S rRNA (uracil(1498)-N(3))-methyltransferase [Methylococcaceae bacterium]OYV20799.1 MAG: 16S rRNA (uracil1498-N3)-methyltransferase [Methylococcaceae bacterium NSP1-2]
MRVSRLYTAIPLAIDQYIELDDDNAHYVRTVLRLKKDAKLMIFNGKGGEYSCTVVEVSRKTVRCAIEQWHDRGVESPLQLTLGLSISRGDRMDLSVQKSVELGVNHITPLCTERCVVQFSVEKKLQRLQHWQKIAQHAAEQSGRTMLPELTEIHYLPDWLNHQQGLKVFLDPYAKTSLAELKPENRKVTLLAGPEGGFSNSERDMATAAGFIPVRLGSRILRTETASLAALAAVQMLWGDFGVLSED